MPSACRVAWMNSQNLAVVGIVLYCDHQDLLDDISQWIALGTTPWSHNEAANLPQMHPRCKDKQRVAVQRVTVESNGYIANLLRETGCEQAVIRVLKGEPSPLWREINDLPVEKELVIPYDEYALKMAETLDKPEVAEILDFKLKEDVVSQPHPLRTKTTAPQPTAILKPLRQTRE